MNCSLIGVVVDKNQQPIEDATVLITDSEGSVHDIAALTNEMGEFAFHDLEKGRTRIRIITYEQDFSEEIILTKEVTRHQFQAN